MLRPHEQRTTPLYVQPLYPYSRPTQDVEPTIKPLYHPYSGYSNRDFRHGSATAQEWRPASPPQISTSARWSQENYHDLHHRHPTLAKDLMAERSHSRGNTHSPRDDLLFLNGDRYDSFDYPSFVQDPNGALKTHDSRFHYGRKEI